MDDSRLETFANLSFEHERESRGGGSILRLDTTQNLKNAVKKTPSLYDVLELWLSQPDDWAHLGHLTTCVWMVVALIQTGERNGCPICRVAAALCKVNRGVCDAG